MAEYPDLGFEGYIEFDTGEWLEYAYTRPETDPDGRRYSVLYFLYGSNGTSLPELMVASETPWRKVAEVDPDRFFDAGQEAVIDPKDYGTHAMASIRLLRGEGQLMALRAVNNYLRNPAPGLEYYCEATNQHFARLRRIDRDSREVLDKVILFRGRGNAD